MNKSISLILALIISASCYALRYPSIEQVATKLYSNYSVPQYANDTTVTYEKKRDGWHIVKSALPKGGDYYLPIANELFWSSSTGKYNALKMFTKGSSYDFMNRVRRDKYVAGFYDFERCPYFGYEGWYNDVILDFGGTIPTNDTLVEALARAYSTLAMAYIGNQYGYAVLAQVQLPEKERLDLYVVNAKKEIEYYDVLRNRNPHFGVLIGEVTTKYANEVMAHYETMMYYGREKEFNSYFNEELYDPFTRGIAGAMLENCNADGILFTNGDNDTYPLWYMQWFKGVRKDVTVMNLSLMNVDHYLDRYREDFRGAKAVIFTLPKEFYMASDYYPVDNSKATPIDPATFFSDIKPNYTLIPGDTVYPISHSQLEITNPDDAYSKYELLSGIPKVTISIYGRYLLQSDLAMLDIICSNHETRGVYFVSSISAPSWLRNCLYEEGIISRFIPDDSGRKSLIYTSHASVKIANQKLGQVLKIDTACIDRTVGKYWMINVRSAAITLSHTMLQQNDTIGALLLLDKMYAMLPFSNWKPETVDYYATELYYRAGKPESGDFVSISIMDQVESDSKVWSTKTVLSDDENSDRTRSRTILQLIMSSAQLYHRDEIARRADELDKKIK